MKLHVCWCNVLTRCLEISFAMNRFPVVANKLRHIAGTSKLLQTYNIGAAKQLSQNFIFDQNLLDRIVRHSVTNDISSSVRLSIKNDLFKEYGLDLEEIGDLDIRSNLDNLAFKLGLPDSFASESELSRLFTNRLIELEPLKHNVCIDVGSGPGGIARSLLKLGSKHVIAVEPDRRFIPILEYLQDVVGKNRMTVVNSRFEKWDAEETLAEVLENYNLYRDPNCIGSFIKVFGNLPFAVATEITEIHLSRACKGTHVYKFDPKTELYFMYQLEVARKMCGASAALTKNSKTDKKSNNPLFRCFNHSFDTRFLQKVDKRGMYW